MILVGDAREKLRELPEQSVDCCVTSPPYWGLRDYGNIQQIGLEKNPNEFIFELVDVFREVKRVLKDDGTLWVNMGDSYAGGIKGADIKSSGLKSKDLVGIPWMLAFALRADGWYLRQDIIWHKPNPMPESVRDRCTKSHEYMFLLSKSDKYYFNSEAMQEPSAGLGKTKIRFGGKKYGDSDDPKHATKSGNEYTDKGTRNKRSVWSIATKPFKDAHFATFPPSLIEPCILAGCPEGGTVLDPFFGAGTTGLVAQRHSRNWIGCELNQEYADIAKSRIESETNLFTGMA